MRIHSRIGVRNAATQSVVSSATVTPGPLSLKLPIQLETNNFGDEFNPSFLAVIGAAELPIFIYTGLRLVTLFRAVGPIVFETYWGLGPLNYGLGEGFHGSADLLTEVVQTVVGSGEEVVQAIEWTIDVTQTFALNMFLDKHTIAVWEWQSGSGDFYSIGSYIVGAPLEAIGPVDVRTYNISNPLDLWPV